MTKMTDSENDKLFRKNAKMLERIAISLHTSNLLFITKEMYNENLIGQDEYKNFLKTLHLQQSAKFACCLMKGEDIMMNLNAMIKAVSIGTTVMNMVTMVADTWSKEKKMQEMIAKEVAKQLAQMKQSLQRLFSFYIQKGELL